MIGSTIAHYKITAKLGEGGMGEVYRARDERLKRDVAVKLLPQSVQEDPARLARFKREAQNALTLACGPPTMAIHVWYRRQDSNLYGLAARGF
jgi:serine/threonine protein kinase